MALVSDLVQIGIPARQAPFLGQTVAAGTALAGVDQATAAEITFTTTRFVTGTAGVAFCARMPLQGSVPQSTYYIRNDSGVAMTLFPAVGNAINATALNVGLGIPVNTGVVLVKEEIGLRWIALGSAY